MSSDGIYTGLLVPSRMPNMTTFSPNSPGVRNNPPVTGPVCDRINYIYDIPSASVFSVLILFGILFTFCGYRCFKLVMFLIGFIFGTVIVYLITIQERLLPPYGEAGVALLAGVLFGLITMLIQYIGLFITGLHTGLIVALGGLTIADFLLEESSTSIWITLGTLLGSGLLFSVINLHWIRGLTIFGTAVYGGALTLASVDYFIERWGLIRWIWERASLREPIEPPCWFSWIILGIWPSFLVFGLIVQCALTGRGIYHQEPIASRKKSRGNVQRGRTRAERAELRQKKYRYLYQVRTAHGDVISQNFVKSMQKKNELGAPGECSTLQSDATHVTILPDAQLAALTESEDDSHGEIISRR